MNRIKGTAKNSVLNRIAKPAPGFRVLGRRVNGRLGTQGQLEMEIFEQSCPYMVHRCAGSVWLGKRFPPGQDQFKDPVISRVQMELRNLLPPGLRSDPALLDFAVCSIETDFDIQGGFNEPWQ